jgi:hypothetical protein
MAIGDYKSPADTEWTSSAKQALLFFDDELLGPGAHALTEPIGRAVGGGSAANVSGAAT